MSPKSWWRHWGRAERRAGPARGSRRPTCRGHDLPCMGEAHHQLAGCPRTRLARCRRRSYFVEARLLLGTRTPAVLAAVGAGVLTAHAVEQNLDGLRAEWTGWLLLPLPPRSLACSSRSRSRTRVWPAVVSRRGIHGLCDREFRLPERGRRYEPIASGVVPTRAGQPSAMASRFWLRWSCESTAVRPGPTPGPTGRCAAGPGALVRRDRPRTSRRRPRVRLRWPRSPRTRWPGRQWPAPW